MMKYSTIRVTVEYCQIICINLKMLHEWEFDIVLSNIVMDFIRHRAGTQYDSVDCAFIPFHARPIHSICSSTCLSTFIQSRELLCQRDSGWIDEPWKPPFRQNSRRSAMDAMNFASVPMCHRLVVLSLCWPMSLDPGLCVSCESVMGASSPIAVLWADLSLLVPSSLSHYRYHILVGAEDSLWPPFTRQVLFMGHCDDHAFSPDYFSAEMAHPLSL